MTAVSSDRSNHARRYRPRPAGERLREKGTPRRTALSSRWRATPWWAPPASSIRSGAPPAPNERRRVDEHTRPHTPRRHGTSRRRRPPALDPGRRRAGSRDGGRALSATLPARTRDSLARQSDGVGRNASDRIVRHAPGLLASTVDGAPCRSAPSGNDREARYEEVTRPLDAPQRIRNTGSLQMRARSIAASHVRSNMLR